MEKWKIAVIVMLLAALCGYGFFQQNKPIPPETPPTDPHQPTPPPPNQKLLKFKGQVPPSWDIAAQYWINTPRPISLADLKGHVTLLEFWRMECSHCQDAAPHINQLFKQYSQRGLKFVAIHSPGAPGPDNPENDWGKVQQRIKEWGLKYPIAYDQNGTLFKNKFGGDTYPAMLILNREGKVIYVNTGFTAEKEMELQAALANALKK
jgi:thiol-disulfide isomerase/thioredoxin